MEEIGALNRIIFSNQKNYFLIGAFNREVDFGYESFTAVGSMVDPLVGIEYRLQGEWIDNPKFGKQFKFSAYEAMEPEDTAGICKYLVMTCKGIGPSTANKIMYEYDVNAIEILKKNPDKVSKEIKGITIERAKEIQHDLMQKEEMEKTIISLEKIFYKIKGLRKDLSILCIKFWGHMAIGLIKKNPYILTDIKGVGFLTADQIAQTLGIAPDDIFRLKAGIQYGIEQETRTGHVWVQLENLQEVVTKLLKINLTFFNAIEEMIFDKILVKKELSSKIFYSLDKLDKNETIISEKVILCIRYQLQTEGIVIPKINNRMISVE